jgi:hypothetical protein
MPTIQETIDAANKLLNRVKTEGVVDSSGNLLSGSSNISIDQLNKPQTMAGVSSFTDPNADLYKTLFGQPQNNETDPMAELLKWYTSESDKNKIVNPTDTYNQLYQQGGIGEKELKVKNLQDQINAINANQSAQELALKGEGINLAGASARNISLERQNAIKLLPLQAQLAAEQGNLELAQSHLDTAYKLQSEYATNLYNWKQKQIDAVFSFASAAQQRKLEEKKITDANDFQLKLNDINYQHETELAKLNASLKPVGGGGSGGGVGGGGTTSATPAQLGIVNDVNSIINDPAFKTTFGFGNTIKRNFPGNAEYNLKANISNLIDKLSLAARGQLKGQGTVSDFEGKMLKNAQTALKFNMTPEQALQHLINIRGAISTSSGGTATVEIKDMATGKSQLVIADQAGIQKAIEDGLLVTYK